MSKEKLTALALNHWFILAKSRGTGVLKRAPASKVYKMLAELTDFTNFEQNNHVRSRKSWNSKYLNAIIAKAISSRFNLEDQQSPFKIEKKRSWLSITPREPQVNSQRLSDLKTAMVFSAQHPEVISAFTDTDVHCTDAFISLDIDTLSHNPYSDVSVIYSNFKDKLERLQFLIDVLTAAHSVIDATVLSDIRAGKANVKITVVADENDVRAAIQAEVVESESARIMRIASARLAEIRLRNTVVAQGSTVTDTAVTLNTQSGAAENNNEQLVINIGDTIGW